MKHAGPLLLHDEAMLGHDAGPGHPERPQRLASVRDALRAASLPGTTWVSPEPVTAEQILRVHTAAYLDQLESLRDRHHRFDADTACGPGSHRAAWLAAGAAVNAVEAVVRGDASNAFALVRPPGHHAEPDRAMGFCLLNNIAIAAAHALATLDVHRVLIVDWDVHHGNGTQAAFYDRADVLYFSTHQWPLFPGTGAAREVGSGAGEGYTLNVPLEAGCDDADLEAVFREVLVPAADAYRPELVLVSAGFDAHRDDPLGGMNMTEDGFVTLLAMVRRIADRHAGGRLALVLEGGYDVGALSRSVVACVEGLAGSAP